MTDMEFLDCGCTAPTDIPVKNPAEDFQQRIRNVFRTRKPITLNQEGPRLRNILRVAGVRGYQVPPDKYLNHSSEWWSSSCRHRHFTDDFIKRSFCERTGYDVYDGWIEVDSALENIRTGKDHED